MACGQLLTLQLVFIQVSLDFYFTFRHFFCQWFNGKVNTVLDEMKNITEKKRNNERLKINCTHFRLLSESSTYSFQLFFFPGEQKKNTKKMKANAFLFNLNKSKELQYGINARSKNKGIVFPQKSNSRLEFLISHPFKWFIMRHLHTPHDHGIYWKISL